MESGSIENNVTEDGAAVYNLGKTTINSGFIKNNTAKYGAGAIINMEDAELIMNGGTIEGNKANHGPGGILNLSTATLNGVVIKGNSGLEGGGIHSLGTGTMTITNTTIENNKAGLGGGIFNEKSLTLGAGTIIKNNTAIADVSLYDSQLGGGIYHDDYHDLKINGAKITENNADKGAGIYIVKGEVPAGESPRAPGDFSVRISGNTEITQNKAKSEGGGIYTERNGNNYADLTSNDYQNLEVANTVTFNKNTASAAYFPPEIAPSYSNVKYKTTSLKNGSTYINLINNYDINYIGKREVIYYTLSYNANTGTGTVPAKVKRVSDTEVTISDNGSLSKKGYKFVSWNTKADGSGTSYNPGDKFTITKNSTLYAQWKKDENGGGGGGGSKTSDNNNALPWIALVLIAGAGIVITAKKFKKEI